MLPLLLVFAPVSLEAQGRRAGSQEDRDSLVRLISADMARLVEVYGQQYRKVVGNAVFLHNGTYLRCDSAYWNVSGEYIDAKGHIRIEQDGTLLTGDSIKYDIPSNTARFRGHLVELIDRDSNILRTNYLDYNTKDSTAFFYRGGAMKDADGNLIESVTGRYSSPDERFDFIGQVEMFSDSLFFVCDSSSTIPETRWPSSAAAPAAGTGTMRYPPERDGMRGPSRNSISAGTCISLPPNTSFGATLSTMTGQRNIPVCSATCSFWIQWTMPWPWPEN